jgi:hypothetical protein
MTTCSKSNNKSYLTRGSLVDDYLKKNHPDNIRKTILKKSKFSQNTTTIKENIENENENEINDKKEAKENNLKNIDKIRYSLSFGDDLEEEEEEDEDKEEDQKLFNLLENEDDPELKELRKYYFGEKDLKKSLKKMKSIMKKKTVKFQDEEKKEKLNDSNIKKLGISKKTSATMSGYGELDKYEDKLKEFNKNLKITSDKEIDSHLDINLHDDIDEKFKENLYTEFIRFYNDINPIKNLDFMNNNDMPFNIEDIQNNAKKKFLLNVTKDKPNQKMNLFDECGNTSDFDKIDKIFQKKKKPKYISEANGKDKSKKDESTQTEPEDYLPRSNNSEKIKQTDSTIYPDDNSEYFDEIKNNKYYNDNYTYNGNNPISRNKYKDFNQTYNPSNRRKNYTHRLETLLSPDRENGETKTIIYNQTYSNISYNQKKNNRVNETLKKYYYKNEDKNIDEDTFIINKKKYIRFPNSEMNDMTNDNFLGNYSTADNKNLSSLDLKNHLFDDEKKYFTKNITRKKIGLRNIKDEVLMKRNEIIEKIQNCQNLINTIMNEKINYIPNNKRKAKRNLGDYNSSRNKSFFAHTPRINRNDLLPTTDDFNFDNDIYNDKYNYTIYNNEPKDYKRIAYKKISVQYDKPNNSKQTYDNDDKDTNGLSLQEEYSQKKNNYNKIGRNTKKDINSKTPSSYYSFDNQEKDVNNFDEYLPLAIRRKIISKYNEYDKHYSFSTNPNKNFKENQIYNNKTTEGINQNPRYINSKDISYEYLIRNDNKSNSTKKRIIKGSRNHY